ncbi:unnamed protein product [Gemmata massiliana]|uniref:STAS/SEC14 domain-containing protein n=1 Tax=Gemmata massiliana TaxID=1210884 RepID=A0A6P2CRT9_9BACT|nr:hypothetical protein [Gemmata massiliana]VTR91639.1 unnamed protein product [Gemmata massiliana]
MAINFTVDGPARLVRATVSGPTNATLGEFESFLDALVAHPDFRRGFAVLYDRRAVAAPPDDTFIRAATEAIERRAARLSGCRWAVVIGDQPALSVVHMTALLGERAGVEARPFFAPEDARAWLG